MPWAVGEYGPFETSNPALILYATQADAQKAYQLGVITHSGQTALPYVVGAPTPISSPLPIQPPPPPPVSAETQSVTDPADWGEFSTPPASLFNALIEDSHPEPYDVPEYDIPELTGPWWGVYIDKYKSWYYTRNPNDQGSGGDWWEPPQPQSYLDWINDPFRYSAVGPANIYDPPTTPSPGYGQPPPAYVAPTAAPAQVPVISMGPSGVPTIITPGSVPLAVGPSGILECPPGYMQDPNNDTMCVPIPGHAPTTQPAPTAPAPATPVSIDTTGLDKSITDGLTSAATVNSDLVDSTLGGTKDDTIWTRLKTLGDIFTSANFARTTQTTFSDHVTLPEPDVTAAGAQSIDAIWSELSTFFVNLFSGGKSTVDSLQTMLAGVPFILGLTIEGPLVLLELGAVLLEMTEPIRKFLKEDIAAKSGLAKLPADVALAGWLRSFVHDEDLDAELAANGWSAERIQVMKDLRSYLLPVETAIELSYRKLITEPDLRDNMSQHGMSTAQQDVIIAQSYKLIDIQTASKLYLRKVITDVQLDSILLQHRMSAEERTMFFTALLEPPDVAAAMDGDRANRLVGSGLVGSEIYTSVPDSVDAAGSRSGQTSEATQAAWQAAFYFPPLREWLDLFFRHIRSGEELDKAMDFWRVLPEFRNDVIAAGRPLIPFRTIPQMMALGVIDEPQARSMLGQHGFSDDNISILIDYVDAVIGNRKHKAVGDLKDVSIGSAKMFWEQGAIGDTEYHQALMDHGYSESEATLTLKAESIREHALQRKQAGTDIVNEVLAGQLSVAQAQDEMASLQMTAAEQAKILRRIVKTKRAAAKMPTEAELRAMAAKGIITTPEYTAFLEQIGYDSRFADYFTRLHFPAPAK